MRKKKTKRTLSPEHLAALQAGRKKKQIRNQRMSDVKALEKRLYSRKD